MSVLPFTGERFTPECEGRIAYEHVARYRMALDRAHGKDVLDLACGEGYGSSMLATVANSVVGVDVAAEAVNHAKARYAGVNFVCSPAHALPLAADRFDLVVSFETLEHLREHDEMMAEVKRVLRPDGSLIISSPNKAIYTDRDGMRNPHHLRELYLAEFRELLARHFSFVEMYGQRILGVSVTTSLDEQPDTLDYHLPAAYEGELMPDAQYFIALASNAPNPAWTQRMLDSIYWDPGMEPR